MGKRTVFDTNPKDAHNERHPKRQRIENSYERESPRPAGGVEEVTTARQLQSTLIFDQSTASSLRSGLNQFKRFLDSILYSAEEHALPRQRAILREYLDWEKGKGRDNKDKTFLSNLIQAWDYAAETNFEVLLAQVTAVLALLFKVFSSHGDFLEYGTLLTKTILQPSVARRLVRSTSAATNKENIISPALRLLTELTKFNEGANARAVYSKRDFTLEPKILGRNIALWKESNKQSVDELHRKPSIRTTAIRYLLTHLRYQDERAKIEILSNSNIVRAIFDHLITDPPLLIFEIFDVFKNHVFQDKAIPRSTKARILNGRALSRVASLYSYSIEDSSLLEGQKAPDELAHEFLCFVCTDPAYGVMLPTNGFYPPMNEEEEADVPIEDAADYGASLNFDTSREYGKTTRIRNVILADFLQNQKPYANTFHQQLVLNIFKACPELVADYFGKKQDFNYDPKLTSTWIGFSAFLYQTIDLPVPLYLGARRTYRENPPPVTILLQNILPQPLNQQVLSRCLNHSSELIQFFTVRVLIVAFHKLQAVLEELNNAGLARTTKPWEQASKRLIAEFGQRCPPVKAIILAMKKPAFQKDMKREAITKLLRLYFEITPQVALQEKFDVSLPLCNALLEVDKPVDSPEDRAFRVMELEHWIQMARHSPAMRWWQRHKSLPHSPFITLIRLLVASKDSELYTGVRSLLVSILRDQDMLQTTTSPNALEALIASLGAPFGPSNSSAEVLDFLDECCARFVKVPIKYFDDLDAMSAWNSQSAAAIGPFSPLLMTLVEQWPFKGGKTENGNAAEPIVQWLSRLLYLLRLVGEDESILTLVRDSLLESAHEAYKEVLKDSFLWKMGKERAKEALKLATGADLSGSERSSASPIPQEPTGTAAKSGSVVDLEQPPEEDEKHNGLVRWRKKNIEEAIDDGDIGELLLCLCSKHTEIRVQAVSNIRQLMATIGKEEGDLQQLYVLLGIMLESSESIESKPLPYVGGVLAARCVNILADPMHFMFSKINKFLVKLPLWEVGNLPRKFWRVIVASEPEEDISYHREVEWYLNYLIDCLRTPQDMEIFRRNNLFERLLSFYVSKSCSNLAKEKIVRLLLRAAAVGGSTTLITRCGLFSWLQMMLEKNDHRDGALRIVASRVFETCDQAKVADWSSGKVAKAVAAMAKVGA